MGRRCPPAIIEYEWVDPMTQPYIRVGYHGYWRTDLPEACRHCVECCFSESRSIASTDHSHQCPTCVGGDHTSPVTQDKSQDCVAGLLEQGLLQAEKLVQFFIFLCIISLAQGFWGGSNPWKHCTGSNGRPRFCKPWFVDHRRYFWIIK